MKIINILNKHRITVDAKTLLKFEYVIKSKYNLEFTAFTHAERRADDEFYIYDIFFPRQDNTAVTTECDSDDIIELMDEGADISCLSGHIHSHVDMDVFPSGTDEKDIKERAKDAPFNVALIINKKGEMYGHLVDMETGLYFQDVDITVYYPFTSEEYEEKLLELIRTAETVKDAGILSRIDEWGYYEIAYALTDEEKEELDDIVKNKFKYKSYYTPKSTGVGYQQNFKKKEETTATKPITYLDSTERASLREVSEESDWGAEWEKDYEYADYIQTCYGDNYSGSVGLLNAEELEELVTFTEEELEMWEEIKNKDQMQLTEKEWMLYDKMYYGKTGLQ